MSENTTIEWCDASINFWHGCTKVSPGCKNCYAEKWDKRKMHSPETHFGKGIPRLNLLESARNQAMKLDRKAAKFGKRLRVFTNSMGDWLDEEVPIEWLVFLLETVRMTPNLDWLLLTKRPDDFGPQMALASCTKRAFEETDLWDWIDKWMDGEFPQNVWIGTSIEDGPRKVRIEQIREIPAKVRFLSCEPLLADLGFLDLRNGIDWVIVGGESGAKAREFNSDWARELRDECAKTGTAFFMKQMGGTRKPFPAIPDDLMVREFPKGGLNE